MALSCWPFGSVGESLLQEWFVTVGFSSKVIGSNPGVCNNLAEPLHVLGPQD